MVSQTPKERLRQLRAQILIHSYLYYWCDDPLWSDARFDSASKELVERQALLPRDIGFYDDAFRGWTGASGYDLPRDSWVIGKANQLWRYRRTHKL